MNNRGAATNQQDTDHQQHQRTNKQKTTNNTTNTNHQLQGSKAESANRKATKKNDFGLTSKRPDGECNFQNKLLQPPDAQQNLKRMRGTSYWKTQLCKTNSRN